MSEIQVISDKPNISGLTRYNGAARHGRQPNHDNTSIRTQGVIAGPRHGLDIPAGSEAERFAWQARGAGDESESCHDD
jgi:hypothetical protein